MWQISRVIGLAFMTGFSVEDLRFRTVSRDLLSIMAILGIGYQLWTRETSWKQIMGGVVIGMFFIFISFITKEALGYGDSILISILGIVLTRECSSESASEIKNVIPNIEKNVIDTTTKINEVTQACDSTSKKDSIKNK